MSKEQNLSAIIESMVQEALQLKENDVYKVIKDSLDRIIFESTMKVCRYNQSRASKILGVSRGTLRTKLLEYFGDTYVGTRE
jgi:Fis family transcriptional regulator